MSKIKNLLNNLDEKNYLEYFKALIEYYNILKENYPSDNLKFNIEILFYSGINKLFKLIDESDDKEKNLIKFNQLDEILKIQDLPNYIISLCLNKQGFFLLEMDPKLNKNLAFEKLYKAIELSPDYKTFIIILETLFHFFKELDILESFSDQICKNVDKFSDNIINIIMIVKIIILTLKKDYKDAYNIGINYIPKIDEIIENDKDIEVITQLFYFSSSEIYSDLIKDKKILEGEEIFKSVCSCLKYERHKDETKFIIEIS